jgi:lysophospholipase L1-like esterase
MPKVVLILGHSFIARLRRFVSHSDHEKVNTSLNLSEQIIYRGYSGCTITKLTERGVREVLKYKPDLVCLQVGSNDLCDLSVEVQQVVDKLVDFVEILRGHGVRRICVYQILHRKAPKVPCRYAVDAVWFNSRVDLVNKMLNDRMGRDFLAGVRFWRHSGFWSRENQALVYCDDGVHLNEEHGYPKYYNSVRASIVSALKT